MLKKPSERYLQNTAVESEFGLIRAKYSLDYSPKYSGVGRIFYQGNTITHYTDLRGLIGIVESGGLWLSDHRFLNDEEEVENGRKLTVSVLKSLSAKPRHALFKEVLSGASLCLENSSERPYFICSLSSEADSLVNWRGYGNNGRGISITFDNKVAFERNPRRFFFVPPILVASQVVYEEREKVATILHTLRRFAREFAVDVKAGRDVDTVEWSGDLSSWLAPKFINFKHHQYSTEKEVRLIATSANMQSFGRLKHRAQNDRIVPYLDLSELYSKLEIYEEEGSRRLPILEVRVGPTADQEVTMHSVKAFLRNSGYEDVRVCRSEVPFRG